MWTFRSRGLQWREIEREREIELEREKERERERERVVGGPGGASLPAKKLTPTNIRGVCMCV